MKKQQIRISNQDELNKHLQYTSPFTWIALGLIVALLAGFFAWSFLFKLTIKLTGKADVENGAVTLHLENSDLGKLKVGQKVYIAELEGEIISFNDDQPVVSSFALENGEYTYKIVIGEMRPIDFLLSK